MKFARDLVPRIDWLGSRRRRSFPEIADETFWSAYERCKPYSLLHVPGFYNLHRSLHYIAANRLPGAAVECGCFLGGAAAFIGLMRKRLGLTGMEIVLFDTFEGPPIGSTDTYTGGRIIKTPTRLPRYANEVRETLTEITGSVDGFRLIEGLVEDTLPHTDIGAIALLRLDTDFYTSTRAEFEHLYPKLVPGGVLIVDDYGCFAGSRRATDEYFAGLADPPLLNRIDGGIWAGVKPGREP